MIMMIPKWAKKQLRELADQRFKGWEPACGGEFSEVGEYYLIWVNDKDLHSTHIFKINKKGGNNEN